MRGVRAWLLRLRGMFWKMPHEMEFDAELKSHVELHIDEAMGRGMTREQARREALLKLSGLEQTKESHRDQRGLPSLESVVQDVRLATRLLRKNPGFSAVAVLTLALGIGGTTTVFSIIDAALLRGLPYRNPGQLVELGERSPQGEDSSVSTRDFAEWKTSNHSFEELAYAGDWKFCTLTRTGEPDQLWAWEVSTNLFPVLGVRPMVGRTFASAETQAAILSHRYWKTHFSANPDIVGKMLTLDGKPFTVVGVMAPDFYFRSDTVDVWLPLPLSTQNTAQREKRSLSVIGRLKHEVTLGEARTEMQGIQGRLAAQYPKEDSGWAVTLQALKSEGLGDFQTAVVVLFAGVLFTLLIGAVNVTHMFLARGAARGREMALREALGAGSWRLMRQTLTETLLISYCGGLAGIVLAELGLRVFLHFLPRVSPSGVNGLQGIHLDPAVMVFAIALSLAAGLGTGLFPAIYGCTLNLNRFLKEGEGVTARSPGSKLRLHGAFVTLQIALSLVLLVGAGLMFESFYHLTSVHLGFDPSHILTVRVPLAANKYAQGHQALTFYEDLLLRIRAVPGVQSAAFVNNLPFSGFSTAGYFDLPDPSSESGKTNVMVGMQDVSPGYFQTLGIPLLRGRDFRAQDERDGPKKVAIINEIMARRYWPGQDVVGKYLDPDVTVVGVVGDARQESLAGNPEPQVYVTYGQHPFASSLVTFVIRTSSDPLRLAPAVRGAVWSIDADQPVIQIRSMDEVVSESIWQTRVSASVLSALAVMALFLSAVGIYGVVSYWVSQRTREIGVRIALGASVEDLMRLVIGETLTWVVAGATVGVGGSLAVSRLLVSTLYEVKPTNPAILSMVIALLGGVALMACWIPARRAAKVDPMVALRHE